MGSSFSFDSTDLGDGTAGTYGLIVEKTSLQGSAAPALDVQIPPQGLGVVQAAHHGARAIGLNCIVRGASEADVFTKIDSLIFKLDPRNGPKALKLDQIGNRYWLATLASPPNFEWAGGLAARTTLNFIAADQYGYSTTESDDSFSLVSSPDTFNVESAGAVGGTAHARPVWYVRNETGGSVGSVVLTNTTLAETTTWVGTLGDDYWLKFDSAAQQISKSATNGSDPTGLTYTVSMGGWQTGSVFPRLKPATQNACAVTGVSAGTVRWVYRARYL